MKKIGLLQLLRNPRGMNIVEGLIAVAIIAGIAMTVSHFVVNQTSVMSLLNRGGACNVRAQEILQQFKNIDNAVIKGSSLLSTKPTTVDSRLAGFTAADAYQYDLIDMNLAPTFPLTEAQAASNLAKKVDTWQLIAGGSTAAAIYYNKGYCSTDDSALVHQLINGEFGYSNNASTSIQNGEEVYVNVRRRNSQTNALDCTTKVKALPLGGNKNGRGDARDLAENEELEVVVTVRYPEQVLKNPDGTAALKTCSARSSLRYDADLNAPGITVGAASGTINSVSLGANKLICATAPTTTSIAISVNEDASTLFCKLSYRPATFVAPNYPPATDDDNANTDSTNWVPCVSTLFNTLTIKSLVAPNNKVNISTTSAGSSATVTLTNMQEGWYTLVVKGVDSARNESAPQSVNFAVDMSRPNPSTIKPVTPSANVKAFNDYSVIDVGHGFKDPRSTFTSLGGSSQAQAESNFGSTLYQCSNFTYDWTLNGGENKIVSQPYIKWTLSIAGATVDFKDWAPVDSTNPLSSVYHLTKTNFSTAQTPRIQAALTDECAPNVGTNSLPQDWLIDITTDSAVSSTQTNNVGTNIGFGLNSAKRNLGSKYVAYTCEVLQGTGTNVGVTGSPSCGPTDVAACLKYVAADQGFCTGTFDGCGRYVSQASTIPYEDLGVQPGGNLGGTSGDGDYCGTQWCANGYYCRYGAVPFAGQCISAGNVVWQNGGAVPDGSCRKDSDCTNNAAMPNFGLNTCQNTYTYCDGGVYGQRNMVCTEGAACSYQYAKNDINLMNEEVEQVAGDFFDYLNSYSAREMVPQQASNNNLFLEMFRKMMQTTEPANAMYWCCDPTTCGQGQCCSVGSAAACGSGGGGPGEGIDCGYDYITVCSSGVKVAQCKHRAVAYDICPGGDGMLFADCQAMRDPYNAQPASSRCCNGYFACGTGCYNTVCGSGTTWDTNTCSCVGAQPSPTPTATDCVTQCAGCGIKAYCVCVCNNYTGTDYCFAKDDVAYPLCASSTPTPTPSPSPSGCPNGLAVGSCCVVGGSGGSPLNCWHNYAVDCNPGDVVCKCPDGTNAIDSLANCPSASPSPSPAASPSPTPTTCPPQSCSFGYNWDTNTCSCKPVTVNGTCRRQLGNCQYQPRRNPNPSGPSNPYCSPLVKSCTTAGTPPPSCTGGKVWDGSACVCVAPAVWNGSSCAVPTPTPSPTAALCPDGSTGTLYCSSGTKTDVNACLGKSFGDACSFVAQINYEDGEKVAKEFFDFLLKSVKGAHFVASNSVASALMPIFMSEKASALIYCDYCCYKNGSWVDSSWSGSSGSCPATPPGQPSCNSGVCTGNEGGAPSPTPTASAPQTYTGTCQRSCSSPTPTPTPSPSPSATPGVCNFTKVYCDFSLPTTNCDNYNNCAQIPGNTYGVGPKGYYCCQGFIGSCTGPGIVRDFCYGTEDACPVAGDPTSVRCVKKGCPCDPPPPPSPIPSPTPSPSPSPTPSPSPSPTADLTCACICGAGANGPDVCACKGYGYKNLTLGCSSCDDGIGCIAYTSLAKACGCPIVVPTPTPCSGAHVTGGSMPNCTCGDGFQWNGSSCSCPGPSMEVWNNTCVSICPSGQTRNAITGVCEPSGGSCKWVCTGECANDLAPGGFPRGSCVADGGTSCSNPGATVSCPPYFPNGATRFKLDYTCQCSGGAGPNCADPNAPCGPSPGCPGPIGPNNQWKRWYCDPNLGGDGTCMCACLNPC